MRSGPPSVIVAGGGPAGLTVARLLALRGWRVVVAAGGSRAVRRLELLAPEAMRTIAALGLEALLADRAIARPCLGIRRPGLRAEFEDFLRHPAGHGYVVDRVRFDACLRDAARAAGAEILPLRVTGLASDGAALRVRGGAGDGTLPLTGILVDATGRAAMVARRKGAGIAFRDRRVAELIEDKDDPDAGDAPAWLDYRSDAGGWTYRIRGPAGSVQTWRVLYGGATTPGAIRTVDASACILSRAAGEGWIAVGDAAMSFDPIASQGLFNALSSALAASGLLLSREGLTAATAEAWSGAVAATFLESEVGRAAIRAAKRSVPAKPRRHPPFVDGSRVLSEWCPIEDKDGHSDHWRILINRT